MIIISSAKPFSKSEEYARNQQRAAESWQKLSCVTALFYFGHYEEGLAQPKTLFVKPDEEYPRIKAMAQFASEATHEYAAIVNADIVIGPEMDAVEKTIREQSLPSSTSYRYEFDPELYPDLTGAVRHKEDRGMDIFIATPAIWKNVAKEIPEDLWFGHPTWDSWMCGFFCHNLGFGFRHFTEQRCVFHPKHGGRETPNSPLIKSYSPYFTRATRPSPL